MEIELHYGQTTIPLTIPDRNVAEIIRPWHQEGGEDNASRIRTVLETPACAAFGKAAAESTLCVLTDDGTRDMPAEDIFPALAALLDTADRVRFIVCTGTHAAETPGNSAITGEIARAAEAAGLAHDIHVHDCENDRLRGGGTTSRGTAVAYNALADDADLFLVLSDVKCHYFAGYSNPIKNFLPGICSFATVEQNHALALDGKSTFGRHPWHPSPDRRDNPLADDQLEGMNLIAGNRPVYSLITISTAREIQWAGFGPVEAVTARALGIVDERNTRTVAATDRLVVSPGGHPNDGSLYIAQRALELTKNAVTDGGEILFLAACPDGVGEQQTLENFYNRLILPLDEVLESIESDYKLFSHKPYKFARLIRRTAAIRMYSELPDAQIADAHLVPAADPAAVVARWIEDNPAVKINVVDGANKIALY